MNPEKQETAADYLSVLRATLTPMFGETGAQRHIGNIEKLIEAARRDGIKEQHEAAEPDRQMMRCALQDNEQLRQRLAAVEAELKAAKQDALASERFCSVAKKHANDLAADNARLAVSNNEQLAQAQQVLEALPIAVEFAVREDRRKITDYAEERGNVALTPAEIEQAPRPDYEVVLNTALARAEIHGSTRASIEVGQGESTSTPLRPMATAPRDGTPVLLKFKSGEPIPERCSYYHGVPFVGLNRNNESDWVFTGNVGVGGIPDDWLEGWLPLHDTIASQGETYHCCNCPWHGDKSQAEEKSSLEDEGRRFYRACPECGFEALPALPDSGAGGVSEEEEV